MDVSVREDKTEDASHAEAAVKMAAVSGKHLISSLTSH